MSPWTIYPELVWYKNTASLGSGLGQAPAGWKQQMLNSSNFLRFPANGVYFIMEMNFSKKIVALRSERASSKSL